MYALDKLTPYVPDEVLDRVKDLAYEDRSFSFSKSGIRVSRSLGTGSFITFLLDNEPSGLSSIFIDQVEYSLHWTVGTSYNRPLEEGPALLRYDSDGNLIKCSYVLENRIIPLREVLGQVSRETKKEIIRDYL